MSLREIAVLLRNRANQIGIGDKETRKHIIEQLNKSTYRIFLVFGKWLHFRILGTTDFHKLLYIDLR